LKFSLKKTAITTNTPKKAQLGVTIRWVISKWSQILRYITFFFFTPRSTTPRSLIPY
jgi:hypothetical protein